MAMLGSAIYYRSNFGYGKRSLDILNRKLSHLQVLTAVMGITFFLSVKFVEVILSVLLLWVSVLRLTLCPKQGPHMATIYFHKSQNENKKKMK